MAALRRKGVKSAQDLRPGNSGRLAGTLATRNNRKSARGNRFAFVEFSDPDGIWEAAVWADELEKYDELLVPGSNLVCHVELKSADEGGRLVLKSAQPVEQVAEDAASVGLEVYVDDEDALQSILNRLEMVSTEARRRRGEGPVRLKLPVYEHDQEVTVDLPGQYAISAEIRGALKSVPGVQAVAEF